MRAWVVLLFGSSVVLAGEPVLGPQAATGLHSKLRYPPAERQPVIETLFGTEVADPYRWLEDGHDPKVQAWAKAEDQLTRAQLGRLSGRSALMARLKQLTYVERVGVPDREGGRLFFERTAANSEKAVVFVRGPGGRERPVLNPLELAPDGTISIAHWRPSHDGRLLLYTRNPNNADEGTLYIRDASTSKDLPEHIDGVTYGMFSWDADGKGFYYVYLPPEAKPTERVGKAEVRHHVIGTDVKTDRVERPGTDSGQKFPTMWTSRDGRWLFYGVDRDSHEDDVWVRDLRQPGAKFQPLAVGLPAWTAVEALGDRFYVFTNWKAPRGRVLVMNTAKPLLDQARELVPEDPSALLEDMSLVGGRMVLRWLRDASSRLEVRELDGTKVRDLPLPELGTVTTISGEPEHDELFFDFASFTTPDRVFRASVKGGEPELWAQVKIPVDPAPYLAEQVWYPSKDGTRISMFIVRRKDAKLDGSTPFLLEGYGGFAINWTPFFTVGAWLESGGGLAFPNLRGGGEYGEEWHKAGIVEHKQNVFDDFIAAAEFLIAHKYTRRERLAALGGSNGGLLMGAALTQRPELFRAVVCAVPLLDMIRYPKFGVASMWSPEFGFPDKEPDFRTLSAYSPYHHVRAAAYPAVLFLSSDSDDRVDPAHARKMTAALQAANTARTPIFLRIQPHAGHGGADAREAGLEETADRSLFLFKQLGFAPRPGAPWLPVLEKSAAPR